MEFVGDLSIQDAKVLTSLGKRATHILEFGSGGSTQIFAQCNPVKLVSVETDPAWIKRTKINLSLISHDKWTKPEFLPYDLFKQEGVFDLIFVDGVPDKRLDFAMKAWAVLDTGGHMIFHDTRHFNHFREAAWVVQSFFGEIRKVSMNEDDSNLTIIEKGPLLAYQNWNYTEGKPLWAYGAEPMPEGAKLWKIDD
jgi:precorrin-6B methylase 2